MLKLRAIYLPDLAFDPDTSLIFEYNKEIDKFEKMDDRDIAYDASDLIKNSNWRIFETELRTDIVDDIDLRFGRVREVSNGAVYESINKI